MNGVDERLLELSWSKDVGLGVADVLGGNKKLCGNRYKSKGDSV